MPFRSLKFSRKSEKILQKFRRPASAQGQMANGDGVRRPVVRFQENLPTDDDQRLPPGTTGQLKQQDSQEEDPTSAGGHCSNRLFLAILVPLLLLLLGAIVITLVLVFTREKEQKSPSAEPNKRQLLLLQRGDNCADMANNCEQNTELCRNEFYKGMMAIYCRKSCGHCDLLAPATSDLCFDRPGFADRCQNWKRNGFCENPFYTEATRRDYCAKTCELCGPSV